MNSDDGMITFVGEKLRDSSGSCRSIVVSELTKGEEAGPVVLLVVAEDVKVLLKGLIELFRLSIIFWVITRCEVNLHVQGLT